MPQQSLYLCTNSTHLHGDYLTFTEALTSLSVTLRVLLPLLSPHLSLSLNTQSCCICVYASGLLQQSEREKLWPSQLFPMLQSPLLSNREQNKSTSLPSNPFHLLPSSTAALPHYKPLSLPLHTHAHAPSVLVPSPLPPAVLTHKHQVLCPHSLGKIYILQLKRLGVKPEQ